MKFSTPSANPSPHSNLIVTFGILFALTAALLSAVGCNKEHSSRGSEIVVAPSAACASGTAVVPQTWGQTPHANYGFVPYGAGYQDQYHGHGHGYGHGLRYAHQQNYAAQGYCDCPAGYQPMCDGQYGMTCVPVQYLGQTNIAWWQLGAAGQGFGYAGYGGVGYATQTGAACPSRIGRTCNVGSAECGYGSHCSPIDSPFGLTPTIGVCTQ